VNKSIGQGVHDIAGDHANLAIVVASDIAGESMNIDAELRCLERWSPLGDQSGDDSREDVASSAGCHPWMSR
jgi:hypothetical protein